MIRRPVALGVALGAALAALTLAAGPADASPTAPAEPPVQISSARPAGDAVQLVTRTPGPPGAPAPEAGVSAGGRLVPARTTPLLADDGSLVLVADMVGTPEELADARSGLTALLLTVSPELPTGVISDGRPPRSVEPVVPGIAEDVSALANLPALPVRSTSQALGAALAGQEPDMPPRTVVLWTGAPDAGGEPAADLAGRLLAANAVLVVVSPKVQSSGYWATVTNRTGGFVTSPSPGERALRAFDRLSDILRSSYVVTFDRPAAGGRAELRWAAPGSAPVTVPFTLPAGGTAGQQRRPAAAEDGGAPLALVAGLVGLAFVLAGVVVLTLRRRARPAGPAPWAEAPRIAPRDPGPQPPQRRPGERTAPSGVRVFDVRDERPREIGAADLFEPRAVRDARQRAEQAERSARERRDQQD